MLQVSLIVFLLSRFLMTWVIGKIRATKVLAALAVLAVLLCLYAMASPNITGVIALVAVSFCLSLMFPTIYGVALQGLGPATKLGAAGLVMAIVGGRDHAARPGRVAGRHQPGHLLHRPGRCASRWSPRSPSTTSGHQNSPDSTRQRWRDETPSARGVLALSGPGRRAACTACTTQLRASEPTTNLEVVSWWTSGSEQQALNVLFDAYRAATPT